MMNDNNKASYLSLKKKFTKKAKKKNKKKKLNARWLNKFRMTAIDNVIFCLNFFRAL